MPNDIDYDLLLGEMNNLTDYESDRPTIYPEDLVNDPLSVYRHALKKIVKPNILAESGPYKAICLNSFSIAADSANRFSLFAFGFTEKVVYKRVACYARIPELHSILPNPFSIKDPEKKAEAIRMHPVFISELAAEDLGEGEFPNPGAVIEVDFEDRKNRRVGIYKRKLVSSPTPGVSSGPKSRKFKPGDQIVSLSTVTNLASDSTSTSVGSCNPKQKTIDSTVKRKPLIIKAWEMLSPFFPSNAVMTSGFRTPGDQIATIEKLARNNGVIGAEYPTWREKRKELRARGFLIADPNTPQTSGHYVGNTFDVSGNGIRSLSEPERRDWLLRVAEISQLLSEDEFFPVKLITILVEYTNNAVHIEIESAEVDQLILMDRFMELNPNCDSSRVQSAIDDTALDISLMESDLPEEPEVVELHDADAKI